MERIVITKKIPFLEGKQKTHTTQVLNLLYDNGPLSAWTMSSKLTDTNKHSLYATLCRRLKILEKKGYVRKSEKLWLLRFKGIIVVLLTQTKPKMWNPKWKEIFEHNAKIIETESKPIMGLDADTIQKYLKISGLCLDDFDTWINFSNIIKTKLDWINFDKIKESTLLGLIILEAKNLEEITSILHPQEVNRFFKQ